MQEATFGNQLPKTVFGLVALPLPYQVTHIVGCARKAALTYFSINELLQKLRQ